MEAHVVSLNYMQGVLLVNIDALRENYISGELKQVYIGKLCVETFYLVWRKSFEVHFSAKKRFSFDYAAINSS